MSIKRENYISWDEYFMGVAQLSAMRSKDPNTQVGACIVSPENRIVGVGYNGLPEGCSDDLFPWTREGEDNKYLYVIHAEKNAILNAPYKLCDCKLYTTHFPCNECCKVIIQKKIREIIYSTDQFNNMDRYEFGACRKMLNASGVTYRQLKSGTNIVLTF